MQDVPSARYLVNFEAFQRVTGAFQAAAAVVANGVAGVTGSVAAQPAKTVTGTAAFYQNPFTGNKSKYKIILNGLAAGDKYHISLADDCGSNNAGVLVAPVNEVKLASGTVGPVVLFNTVKVYGQNDDFNIDGAGGKTLLGNKMLIVRKSTDMTGDIIGCTAAGLA